VRNYLEQETTELPDFYIDKIRRDLGPMWESLPKGAVHHDAYAFLKKAARERLSAVADVAVPDESVTASQPEPRLVAGGR
jgi:hypothetical protein